MENQLVKTICPICGKEVELYTSIVSKDYIKKHNDNPNDIENNLFYKGARWTFINSCGLLAKLNGIPFKVGKVMGEGIADAEVDMIKAASRSMERGDSNIAALRCAFQAASNSPGKTLNKMTDSYIMIEIRCSTCSFVLKRYYLSSSLIF